MIDFDANYNRRAKKKKKKERERERERERNTFHVRTRPHKVCSGTVDREDGERILPSPAPEDEIVKLEWLESSEKLKSQ